MSQQQRKVGAGEPLSGAERVLTGKDYRATVRLSSKDNVTLADVGETCERVPVASWSWLIDQGLMVLVQE